MVYDGGKVPVHGSLLHAVFPTMNDADFTDIILMPEASEADIRIILKMAYQDGR